MLREKGKKKSREKRRGGNNIVSLPSVPSLRGKQVKSHGAVVLISAEGGQTKHVSHPPVGNKRCAEQFPSCHRFDVGRNTCSPGQAVGDAVRGLLGS